MNARYYEAKTGRFISQDPAFLAVGNDAQLKSKTGLDLQSYLSDPQGLNSYAYARNNPLAYIDETGDFFTDVFGINISNGQRGVANSFHNLGNYFRSQGYIGHGAGFVSDITGDVANNVANVFDPRQDTSTRIIAVGVSVLDVGSGGKGSGIGKTMGLLNNAQNSILNASERQIISGTIQNPTLRNIFKGLFKASDRLPGGTAGAIKFEQTTGILLSPSGHMEKGMTTLNGLNKILHNPNVNQGDKAIAKTIFNQLNNAINGK